jgi:hypothetical protein
MEGLDPIRCTGDPYGDVTFVLTGVHAEFAHHGEFHLGLNSLGSEDRTERFLAPVRPSMDGPCRG